MRRKSRKKRAGDVEEQEGDQEGPRRSGLPVQRKECGDHHPRHVKEFVPPQIMERHPRQERGRRQIRQAAGLPVEKRCMPVPPAISG